MFSSIKMEEYMESEPSGIFLVKLVAKNIVLWSLGTHSMHMRVSYLCLITSMIFNIYPPIITLICLLKTLFTIFDIKLMEKY